jgi:hypothetical protein
MCTSFTEHVRDFGPDCDPADCVLPRLKKLLKQRMRRRSLVSAPLAYLGYGGAASWNAPGAFEDILVDCYIFAFLDRLPGLRNQLLVRPNIDGLIVRNVDNFLFERQRKHDPVGHAVFSNVGRAVRDAVAAVQLAIDGATDGRLHSSSVLRLDPSRPEADVADVERVQAAFSHVLNWSTALPALTSITQEGQEWVAKFMDRLRDMGISAVRCGDVVAVLAAKAREDRASLHAVSRQELTQEGDDDFATLVRMVSPDQSFEDRDHWEALKSQIADRIAGLDRQRRVVDRLLAVFRALVGHIDEGGASLPSQAELVERLGVPRATLSDDFRLLRGIIEELFEGKTEA